MPEPSNSENTANVGQACANLYASVPTMLMHLQDVAAEADGPAADRLEEATHAAATLVLALGQLPEPERAGGVPLSWGATLETLTQVQATEGPLGAAVTQALPLLEAARDLIPGEAKFDPDQARDEQGRWSEGGGGGTDTAAYRAPPVQVTGDVRPDARERIKVGVERLPRTAARALGHLHVTIEMRTGTTAPGFSVAGQSLRESGHATFATKEIVLFDHPFEDTPGIVAHEAGHFTIAALAQAAILEDRAAVQQENEWWEAHARGEGPPHAAGAPRPITDALNAFNREAWKAEPVSEYAGLYKAEGDSYGRVVTHELADDGRPPRTMGVPIFTHETFSELVRLQTQGRLGEVRTRSPGLYKAYRHAMKVLHRAKLPDVSTILRAEPEKKGYTLSDGRVVVVEWDEQGMVSEQWFAPEKEQPVDPKTPAPTTEQRKYSPDQPREENGQFGETGMTSEGAAMNRWASEQGKGVRSQSAWRAVARGTAAMRRAEAAVGRMDRIGGASAEQLKEATAALREATVASREARKEAEKALAITAPPEQADKDSLVEAQQAAALMLERGAAVLAAARTRAAAIGKVEEDDMPETWAAPQAGQRATVQLRRAGEALYADVLFGDRGWALSVRRPGSEIAATTGEELRGVAKAFDRLGGRYTRALLAPAQVQAQPLAKADVQASACIVVDEPGVAWGLQGPDVCEYLLSGGREFRGRLVVKRMGDGWRAQFMPDALPLVLHHDTEAMPPDGQSALPSTLEEETPREYRFWKAQGEAARQARDALVLSGWFTPENVQVVNGEFHRITTKLFMPGGIVDDGADAPLASVDHARAVSATFPAAVTLKMDDETWRGGLDAEVEGEVQVLRWVTLAKADQVRPVVAALKKLPAPWLADAPDSVETRLVMSEAGRPFKLVGAQSRKRILVSSERPVLPVLWSDEPEEASAAPASDKVQKAMEAALSREVPVLKTKEEHYVLGIVLEPETEDSQHDVYSAEEIRQCAHRFMEQYRAIGLMHKQRVTEKVAILESWISPCDFDIGAQHVKAGTWLLALRINDDAMWEAVKDGRLTGFSIGGSAIRKPEPQPGA